MARDRRPRYSLSPFQAEKVRRLFSIYDVRDNGVLERDDYALLADRIARERGHAPGTAGHERVTQELFTRFERTKAVADFSRDGKIALDEWVDFFEIVINDDAAFEATVTRFIDMMFELFDFDDSSELDRDELASFRRAFGVEAVDDDLFERLDADGSGTLCASELREAIGAFFRSDDPDAPGSRFFG